ncbi:MAG: hemolysin III family protein [Oligosphaeraceae bacterium]|nr:hemolysin III family protein [Oligosphaeraceae bacterium]
MTNSNCTNQTASASEQKIQRIAALRAKVRFWSAEFHRTRAEEWANAISHLVGTVFGIVALTLMCVFASLRGTAIHVVSCAIYGATLIILFNSSTLYHLIANHRLKSIFQVLDHVSIYLLIAGTYTPFALVTLQGPQGWTVFTIVWGLAALGILCEVVFTRLKFLSLPIYLLMGWLVVGFFKPLMANIPMPGAVMLMVGGVVYTLGVIFYVMDKVPYMHTVWHFFVLGGSVCHWVAINFYVIPR